MDRERELELRLERYEVTTVPAAPALRLVWSAPVAPDEEDDPSGEASEGGVALLSSYRITRVPSRRAAG